MLRHCVYVSDMVLAVRLGFLGRRLEVPLLVLFSLAVLIVCWTVAPFLLFLLLFFFLFRSLHLPSGPLALSPQFLAKKTKNNRSWKQMSHNNGHWQFWGVNKFPG
jgi:hypothetical protein